MTDGADDAAMMRMDDGEQAPGGPPGTGGTPPGDGGALTDEAFFDMFFPIQKLIYKIAYTYLCNREDALDVVQECAYRTYKHIGELRNPLMFKAWACKIALNISLEFLKKNKRCQPVENVIDALDAMQTAGPMREDQAETPDFRFMEMLASLSEHEKDILILKFYFDYTFNMIAREKKTPINTVKSTYYRAIEKLRLRERIV